MACDNIGFAHTALLSDAHYIHLLKFQDNTTNEYLRFSLRAYKFSDELVYNALSYEWGSTTADRTIFINDRPFLIRANLHSFLEILAGSGERSALFFADAICINQEDIPERNAQVQRMSDLYRQAEKVLVWLGPGSAESDLIFDMCTDGKQNAIDLQGSTGDALDKVYQRSYWIRLWIIQELFLARDAVVFCGSKFAPWSSLRRLTTGVKGNIVRGGFTGWEIGLGSSPRGLHARKILSLLNREDSILNKPLDDVVVKLGRAQCFDVRDHIYGLLGLAKVHGEGDRGVKVLADYSATAATLFVRLLSNMPYVLRFSHALDVFNILKLHHVHNCVWNVGIPDTVFSLVFEVGLAHLGHIRHVSKCHPPVCEWCKMWNEGNERPLSELTEHQQQELQGNAISELISGRTQLSLAAHNVGPLRSLGPYDSCVTATEVSEGDEVFLLEGSRIVLIQHKRTPEHASDEAVALLTRGVLAHTKVEDSISQAGALLDNFLSSLPAPTEVRLEKARSRYPFDVIHEEFTLRQIILILTHAGQHSTYWDKPL